MDKEIQALCRENRSCEIPDDNSLPILRTDTHSELELLQIMASLELNESGAASTAEDTSVSRRSFMLRRSQRKRGPCRSSLGSVTKSKHLPKTDIGKAIFHQANSDTEIIDFYKNYNKKYKGKESKCLETIYEEPKEKNGETILSGPKQRRCLAFGDRVSKAKLKKRQSKIKSLFLQKGCKPNKTHFTIEDVKEHLARSGLVNLSAQ